MKNLKDYIVPTLTLFVICLVATALLGLTNQVTAPIIDQLAIETEINSRQVVFADAKSFGEAEILNDGTSVVAESVWDNRFKYVEQLSRMGANIQVDGKVAIVSGVERLKSAPVMANDLRAGAAMLIAGLVADGTTEIENIELIDRGYENVVEKLTGLGAEIKRIPIIEPTAQKKAL